MLRLSYSSVSDFQTCPRKWYYAWYVGARPVGSAGRALEFGRAFHSGQAAWWATDGDVSTRLRAALDDFAKSARNLNPYDYAVGTILLTGYAAHWADHVYRYQSLPIAERKVVIPLSGPDGPVPDVEVTAVFDVLAYDTDGNTVLIEHKSTTADVTPGSKYWDRLEMNLQADLYHIVASDLGRNVSYVLWDAVRAPEFEPLRATPPEKRQFYLRSGSWGKKGDPKPGTRLSDETFPEFEARVTDTILSNPTAFYGRERIYRSEPELDRARADLWGVSQLIRTALDTGAFPRNTDSCRKYGRPCPYLPVCSGQTDISDERLYAIRKRGESDPWDSP